jgi:hypothetical protein
MAARSADTNVDRIGPDAPIFQWVQKHDRADDFDRNGGKVPSVEVTHLREASSEPEIQPWIEHPPVRTLEEIGALRNEETQLESYIGPPDSIELEADNEASGLGLLTRLRMATLGFRMNTLDRSILIAVDKLSEFGENIAKETKPTEYNQFGERRLRKRTKVILGAVALAGVTYASERLGLVHQAQHLVHEAYNGAQGLANNTNEHTHAAQTAHNHISHAAVHNAQPATEHAKHAQQAVKHAKNSVPKAALSQQQIHKTEHQVAKHFSAPPGDSATAEIQKAAAQKGKHISAEKAFRIYQNLKAHLHGHLFRRQYTMFNGQIGLFRGHDAWLPKAAKLLSKNIG